jgi:hypothetical protein
MAALMGTLPIALGAGAGAESRRPLGVAVVGGLAFSPVITLYVTPVFYTYMDSLNHRMTNWFAQFGRKRDGDLVPVPAGAVAGDARMSRSQRRAAVKAREYAPAVLIRLLWVCLELRCLPRRG